MKLTKEDIWYSVILLIISCLTVADLFINAGRSANMDGLIHITTIAQFSQALRDGIFPLRWLDSFANYGLPIGLFSHQLPTYLGAVINMVARNPVLSFNIVSLIAVIFSNLFFYRFLRYYFSPLYAFAGAFFFNIAPYRILNLYIRGAIPETFAAIFLPLVLISMYEVFNKKNWAFFTLILSLTAIVLTHPMMFVTLSFIFIPYFIFLLYDKYGLSIKKHWRSILAYLAAFFLVPVVWAMGLSGYYVIPLNVEVKYFYYGTGNHLTPNQYLHLANFFDPNWYYSMPSRNDIFNRGHFIQAGLIEVVAVAIGLAYILYRWWKRKKVTFSLLEYGVFMSIVIIFFTLPAADIFYKKINLLSNIQFPWRMFSGFIFLPPIVMIYLANKYGKKWLIIALIFLMALIRFPQMYGKNFALYPQNIYYFTVINLHSINMNTIWTGETDSYPVKRDKGEVIEGKGHIISSALKNSSRQYNVQADTNIRMADYTFYFPGWKVYVDGKEVPIEFQDPHYRGVITYNVPHGQHIVNVKFEDTKVRKLGNLVSLASVLAFVLFLLLQLRYKLLERLFRSPVIK